MRSLEEMYPKGFFRGRHRLRWRGPIVADAIEALFDFKLLIDVGCGIGEVVEELRSRGRMAIGLEGPSTALDYLLPGPEAMIFWDLRKPLPFVRHGYDLAVCFEVAEHIEEEFATVFVENLTKLAPRILVSAAPPGQEGHHHFNCQLPEYWEGLFSPAGYVRRRGVEDLWKTQLAAWSKKKELRSWINNSLYFEEEVLVETWGDTRRRE